MKNEAGGIIYIDINLIRVTNHTRNHSQGDQTFSPQSPNNSRDSKHLLFDASETQSANTICKIVLSASKEGNWTTSCS